MNLQDTNWGFSPDGTALGSEGSASMPEAPDLGLGDPQALALNRFNRFTTQVQRRYGSASDVRGSVWDPRGHNALSYEVADFTKGSAKPFAPAYVEEDSLGGGNPVIPLTDTRVNADSTLHLLALNSSNSGLVPETAAKMADTLAMQNPGMIEGIYLPPQVEPKLSNQYGFVTRDGGIPQAMINASTKRLHTGMQETLAGLTRSNNPPLQKVDKYGVVDKYAPGTGPYDAPGIQRPAGFGETVQRSKTASQMQADVTRSLQNVGAASNGVKVNQNIPQSGSDNSAPVYYDADGNIVTGPQASGTPQAGGSVDRSATSVASSQQPVQFADEGTGSKSKLPWLIFAGLGVAALGVGLTVKTRD